MQISTREFSVVRECAWCELTMNDKKRCDNVMHMKLPIGRDDLLIYTEIITGLGAPKSLLEVWVSIMNLCKHIFVDYM